MLVQMHKASDGALFETFEEFAAHEEQLKIKEAVNAATFNTSSFFINEDAGSDALVLAEDSLDDFIAANADVLRSILSTTKVIKRGRRAGAKTEANQAPAPV